MSRALTLAQEIEEMQVEAFVDFNGEEIVEAVEALEDAIRSVVIQYDVSELNIDSMITDFRALLGER